MSVLPPSDRDRPTVNRITGPGDMSAVDAGVTLYAHGGGFEQRTRRSRTDSSNR